MRDGWFMNYSTGRLVGIAEHEQDIRKPDTAKQLSVPGKVFRGFEKYTVGTDRRRFLLDLMQQVPLMRIRGHGLYVTFEYWSVNGDDKPFAAVGEWASRYAGPALLLNVSNLATRRNLKVNAMLWGDFVKGKGKGVTVQVTAMGPFGAQAAR